MQVSTKLNRSHLVHGKRALILPCLGRTEKDHQASGEQGMTVEDSMSMVHLSLGMKEPASPHLRSECAIIAGMAQATLPATARRRGRTTPTTTTASATRWRRCSTASRTSTAARGSRSASASRSRARERVFLTPSGRAEFSAAPLPDVVDPGEGRLLLEHDALARPVEHHDLLERRPLPRRQEPAHARLHEPRRHAASAGSTSSTSSTSPASRRTAAAADACTATAPSPTTSRAASAAGYMPELNVLCAIGDFSTQSDQPLTKHLVAKVTASASKRS